jgi:quercetin dioxygenase-like cupin family protein
MPETVPIIPKKFKKYLEQIEDEKIRGWYEKNVMPYFFVNTVGRFESLGYELRPNGLLVRYVASDENLAKMDMMMVDMALLRPLSEHSHDSDELIIVKGGAGVFYHDDEKTSGTQDIRKGFEAHVPKGTKHYLKPEKDGFLEVELIHSPAPKEGDEKCFRSFDEI